MIRRLRHMLQFQLERFLLGGPQYRLLFLLAVIGVISVIAGTAIFRFDAQATGEPWHYWVWWAFLRLTDPGYLGDDEGILRRSVATVVTVLGYVIFMGALIAVMTQWLNQTIRTLEMGLTPVALKHHVVVLGWSEHTPELVAELTASAGRLRRFLRQFGARRLMVAILAEEVDHELEVSLRQRLGARYQRGALILRSGSSLRPDHLMRVDIARAATVVVTAGGGPTPHGEADSDARLVKTLLTVAHASGTATAPLMVAAARDSRRLELVRSAYPVGRAEIIAIDAIMGRLLAQTLRHPGLGILVHELLDQTFGNELYIRAEPEWIGERFGSLRYREAVILGFVREVGGHLQPFLNPSPDEIIRAGDRMVLLAEDYHVHPALRTEMGEAKGDATFSATKPPSTVVILGWSHLVPTLLGELAEGALEAGCQVDLVSQVPIATREDRLRNMVAANQRLRIRHHEFDVTVPSELGHLPLLSAEAIVIVGSDRLESAEDADARSLAVHHFVRAHVANAPQIPRFVVELRDPSNAGYFAHAGTEVLASGVVISHLLAQIALRRELAVVYDELFGSGGAEITFRLASELGLAGRSVSFAECQDSVAKVGAIALGLRMGHASQLVLNPARQQRFTMAGADAVVLLTTGNAVLPTST